MPSQVSLELISVFEQPVAGAVLHPLPLLLNRIQFRRVRRKRHYTYPAFVFLEEAPASSPCVPLRVVEEEQQFSMASEKARHEREKVPLVHLLEERVMEHADSERSERVEAVVGEVEVLHRLLAPRVPSPRGARLYHERALVQAEDGVSSL